MDISVAELKSHLSEVLRRLNAGEGPVIIRRRGTPVAVLRGWLPSDEAAPPHWSESLLGIAGSIEDFEATMGEIVRSRNAGDVRPVKLDD